MPIGSQLPAPINSCEPHILLTGTTWVPMTAHPHGQHTQAHMPAHTAPKPGSTSATCARDARSCSLPQCLRLTWGLRGGTRRQGEAGAAR